MIKTEAESLQITQTFENLEPKHRYQIILPPLVSNLSAIGKSVNDQHHFLTTKDGNLKLKYTLKINQNKHSMLLTDWLLKLDAVQIYKTKLEIIDSKSLEGSWAAGLPLKGFKGLQYINYYVFEGMDSRPPLYWQDQPLYLAYSNQYFSAFVQDPNKKTASFNKSFGNLKNLSYVTFIYSDTNSSTMIPGMVITNELLSSPKIYRILVANYFMKKFGIAKVENAWLGDVFTSLYLKETAESIKGKFIVEELKKNLPISELHALVNRTLNKDFLHSQGLDSELGNIKGLKTNFFTANLQSPKLSALLFYDIRNVNINGHLAEDLFCLRENNQLFFPLLQTMERFGYSAVEDTTQDAVILKKEKKDFVFFHNQNSFLYNGQKFGLLESPFIKRNDITFINQAGLYTLFKLKISSSNEEINISE
ncbi:MAG: stalk domain-containing protein [Bacillota bacterium]|nr:stalk domain-containing protein [Bacillota bacterium]